MGRGTLATLETTTRITLGPALAAAIAPSPPARAVTISPMQFGYAEANAAARSVPVPHHANEPATTASFMHLMAETGGAAPYFYALPHIIVVALRALIDDDDDVPMPPPIRASAERVGAMFGDHEQVRFALLPAATTAVDAALELLHATNTPRPRMLSLDIVQGPGNTRLMAVPVGDRFAVLASADAQLLRAAHVELAQPSSSVATATLVLSAFPRVFGLSQLPLPQSYHFALEATATEWILRGTPSAAASAPHAP